jgi:hypothetical protein
MQRFRGTAEDRTRLFDNGEANPKRQARKLPTLNGELQTANRKLLTANPS